MAGFGWPWQHGAYGEHKAWTVWRCFVWQAMTGPGVWEQYHAVPVGPTAGGDVDGICQGNSPNADPAGTPGSWLAPAAPGVFVLVEAAAAFSSGASLETTSNGRVQAVSSGKAIMRALEASGGAGSIVRAVFTSGR